MIAGKREAAVTLFLRDYHEARRLLRAGMAFEIGHYTGAHHRNGGGLPHVVCARA